MDTQTRHALKQDKLVQAAQTSMDWLGEHRARAIQLLVALGVVIAALVALLVTYHYRSSAAALAFGEAMDTYSAPLAQAGQPAPPGETVFPDSTARAKAAYQQFSDVANRYGLLTAGKNARYFAGISAMESGQNTTAEVDLKKVAGSYDSNLAALAKVALANLYQQTGRTSQAIDLYQELIAKPTVTVPADAAQLQLAALYESTNPEEAQRIYAKLKGDQSAAGQIAAQKLGTK